MEDNILKPGDVVWYKDGIYIDHSYERQYGRGPFIVDRVSEFRTWHLKNMDGSTQFMPGDSRRVWHTRTEALRKDEFLSAVKQAKFNPKPNQGELHDREDQKRRAAGDD